MECAIAQIAESSFRFDLLLPLSWLLRCASKDWFNRPRLKFLHDAFVLARFAWHQRVDRAFTPDVFSRGASPATYHQSRSRRHSNFLYHPQDSKGAGLDHPARPAFNRR
jgi:hypothetical protein